MGRRMETNRRVETTAVISARYSRTFGAWAPFYAITQGFALGCRLSALRATMPRDYSARKRRFVRARFSRTFGARAPFYAMTQGFALGCRLSALRAGGARIGAFSKDGGASGGRF